MNRPPSRDAAADRVDIRDASSPHELAAARALFLEHAAAVGVDMSYQKFDEELAGLPGRYARPAGRLFVAWRGDEALGCVALRALANGDSEMKRLYLRPAARGTGVGRRLVERLCDEARDAGYARIVLDTLPTMTVAQTLYRSLGFVPIDAYQYSPVEDTRYFGLVLRSRAADGATSPPT